MPTMFEPPPGDEDLWSDYTGGRQMHPVTVQGLELSARVPRAESLAVLSKALSPHAPAQMRNDMIGLFLQANLDDASHERLWEAMLDPDSLVGPSALDEAVRAVATLGTARPTVRSRS